MGEQIAVNELIEADKSVGKIRSEPYLLPWCTMNLGDQLELKELYTLLNENYVEDDDAIIINPTF